MSILTNNGKRLTIGSSTALSFPSVIADGEGQLFNGLNQYDYISDNGTLDINQSTTDFCYGGYITTGSSYSGLIYLLGKQIAGNTDGRYGIQIYENKLQSRLETSGGSVFVDNVIPISTNTKYFVMTRIDLINLKFYYYINNVLQNTGGIPYIGTIATLGNEYEFYLGAGNTFNGSGIDYHFNGRLQDIRIYHKDVSNQQADWMLGKQLGDEVAWWNLPTLTGFGGTPYNLTSVNL